ncbi:MAG: NUDIX domain-containing protein [Actinobacteria bacterium]|nr:NUDIX domain-containing protein [Actinomycetota bacterium]MCG2801129.1 NUDIX domain-containing protein [Cellulomonas sp.]
MTEPASSSAPQRYALDDHLSGRTLLVAAAYVVLRRADQVLLLLRTGTGYMDGWWATLAGHVDPGESVHDAAVREAFEEAGVHIDPADLVPLTAIHRFEPGGPPVEQRLDVFFEVRRWSGEPAVREADKAEAMGWFDLHALPEAVVPHERRVLQALADGLALPAVLSLPSDQTPR